MYMTANVLHYSLRTIAAQLADGALRAPDLIDAALAQHDPALNAYVSWAPDMARLQATAADAAFSAGTYLGGLQGIPISFKDLYGVAGLPTFAGSPCALPEVWTAEGPLVAAVRRQLGVIVGKTHTVEFAFGGLGTSKHHPVPWNPRARQTHRAPGGSSSGAGVCVVEGTALVAFGTDTGGSVRIPASMTGTVGLKTTLGKWSVQGIVPLSPSFDTPGILTRTADDAAFAFEHLGGDKVPDLAEGTSLRIGVAERFFWDGTDPGIAERVTEAMRLLEAAGATLTEQTLPGCGEVYEIYHQGGIVSAELYAFLRGHLPDWLDTLDPRVRQRMDDGRDLPAWTYLHRKSRYAALAAEAAAVLQGYDAIISPTVPITPPPVAMLADADTYARLNLANLRNTCVVSFLGLCAVTIPAGFDAAGLPVGLQLIGAPGREARLLAIARTIENLLAKADIWRAHA
ncbi:amidase [Loktanella sp. M215]|uniref:amidase n=1 Tax=Loktanella sp. M215 TaxID=2675431 RepID=UPI001F376405|nr:amidase [Loktanella sp. M215]